MEPQVQTQPKKTHKKLVAVLTLGLAAGVVGIIRIVKSMLEETPKGL